MKQLTDASRAFLSQDTRTGKLATVRADGRPHIAPIWFVVDGDTIIFMTGKTSVKGVNLLRDERASLCVDDENAPYAFAILDGTVKLSEDLGEMKVWATRIAARYMGEDLAETYGKRNTVPGELLVYFTPTKVLFQENIAG